MDNSEFSWAEVGEIAGTKITLVGEDTPGVETLVLPRSGLVVLTENAFPYLVRALKEFDLESLARLVATVSARRINVNTRRTNPLVTGGQGSHPLLRDYLLALALKLALGDFDRPTASGAIPTGLDLARLCRLAVSSRCDADTEDLIPAEFLTRLAYQQFWDQETFNIWPRGLMMLRDMVRVMADEDRYDIDKAFADLYGLGFTDFVFLSFALFSMSIRQPGCRFDVDNFISSPSFEIGGEEAELFLDLISISLADYREQANDSDLCQVGFDLYNFNPLINWPALRVNAGGVVVPIARLLLDRAIRGIYYDFFGQLSTTAAGRFGNFWGKAFDTYVGEILRATPGLPEPYKGEDLVGEGSACDWAFPCGDRWVLVECKTRGLTLESKTTGRTSAVEQDILGRLDGSSLPKGIAQLGETQATLKEKGVIPSKTECIGMLVTFDQMYFANDDRFPTIDFLRRGAKSLSDQPTPEFVVASISELENVCRAVETRNCDLGEALANKVRIRETRRQDLGLFINQTYKPPPQPISFHSEFLRRGMEELLAEFQREVL